MGQELEQVREHSFDGIEEFDNPLPNWWLWIFYATIAFGVVWWPYENWPGTDRGQEADYRADMAWAVATYGSRDVSWNEAELQAYYQEHADAWQENGKATFLSLCAPCHVKDGGGQIGPNMTDDFYLHGGRLADIANTVTEGVPDKGMLSWKKELTADQTRDVACYVRSLRGTTPAKPKAPQGVEVDAAGKAIQN